MKKLFLFLSTIILGFACLSAQTTTKVYFTHYDGSFAKIYKCDLDGSNLEEVPNAAFSTYRVNGLAVDFNSNKLYFFYSVIQAIYRMDTDGSNKEQIVTSQFGINDIELDLLNNKLFWSRNESSKKYIYRANLDGSSSTRLYYDNSEAYDLFGLAVDAEYERVFWTENSRGSAAYTRIVKRTTETVGTEETIYQASVDANLSSPTEIEYSNAFIYFTDGSDIKQAGITGTGITTIRTVSTTLSRLAIDRHNGNMYWTGNDGTKRGKADGTGEITNIASVGYAIDTDYNLAATPVELTSFTAEQTDDGIMLKWETATEVNNYGFEIERSNLRSSDKIDYDNNLEDYTAIGFVQGHGNSNSPKSYDYLDHDYEQDQELILKYRLKQIDTDGTFEYYSTIATVDLSLPTNINDNVTLSTFNLEQNYPNPFNPTTTIEYIIPIENKRGLFSDKLVTLKIYDVAGCEIVSLVNEPQPSGKYSVKWDASEYPSGIYFARINYSILTKSKKMILVK
jgi:hypothetical protein